MLQVFEYMFILTKGKIKTFNPIKDKRNKTAGDKKHGTIRKAEGTTKKSIIIWENYIRIWTEI